MNNPPRAPAPAVQPAQPGAQAAAQAAAPAPAPAPAPQNPQNAAPQAGGQPQAQAPPPQQAQAPQPQQGQAAAPQAAAPQAQVAGAPPLLTVQDFLWNLTKEVSLSSVKTDVRKYSGAGPQGLRDWLADMARAARTLNHDDEKLRKLSLASLTEEAGLFMVRFLDRNPLATWPQMKDAMQNRFAEVGNQELCYQRLRKLKQKKGQSLASYAEAIYNLAEEALPGQDLAAPHIERQMVDTFVDGVSDLRIAERMIKGMPNTLEEAKQIALRKSQIQKTLTLRRNPDRLDEAQVNVADAEHEGETSPQQADPLAGPMSRREFVEHTTQVIEAISSLRTPAQPAVPQVLATHGQTTQLPRSKPTSINRRPQNNKTMSDQEGSQPFVIKIRAPTGEIIEMARHRLKWNADGTPVCLACHGPHFYRNCPEN